MAIDALTSVGIVTTPAAETPTITKLHTYILDEFYEPGVTDIWDHTPDVNNTGNDWTSVTGKNPVECGIETAGDYHARSKYVSGYTTGFTVIDIGETVNNLFISATFQPYAAGAYYCNLYIGSDAAMENGWVVTWNCLGSTILLRELINGSYGSTIDSDSVGNGGKKTVEVTLSGSDIYVDFNNGEGQLFGSTYSPDGQYVGFSLSRFDSGWNRIYYINVYKDITTRAFTATGISTTPVSGTPTLTEADVLGSTGISTTPVSATPDFTEFIIYNLTATGISTTPTVGSPGLLAFFLDILSANSIQISLDVLDTPSAIHIPVRTYPHAGHVPPTDVPVYILDSGDLSVLGLIEDYYSLIWTERFNEVGDFELDLPISYDGNPLIDFDNFLFIKTSERLMIIEDMKPSISEERSSLLIKGRSAESILSRRVLLNPVNAKENSNVFIFGIIDTNFINATDSNRNIPFLKLDPTPPTIAITYENQVEILPIYNVVETVCKNSDLGFKFSLDTGVTRRLVFYVYSGEDRSISQSTNSPIIFSDNFDNVVSSSFYLSEKEKINVVLVNTDLRDAYGNEEDSDTLDLVFVWKGTQPSGMSRHETVVNTQIDRTIDRWPQEAEPEQAIFEHPDPVLGRPGYHLLDAANLDVAVVMEVNWETEEEEPLETPLTDAEVLDIIITRGEETLNEWKSVGLFEGDFDIYGNFKYGVDFFMGDIVQCNLEGRNVRARIVELVRSYSTEGVKSYVAFDFIID